MAFIANQNKDGTTTLAKRLAELIGHANQLDMLVGFFYFSGVKVLAEAEIEEVALEDALKDIELECKDWNTPRVDFSPEFWKYAMPEEGRPKGVYEALKAYKPKGLLLSKSTIGDAVVAI